MRFTKVGGLVLLAIFAIWLGWKASQPPPPALTPTPPPTPVKVAEEKPVGKVLWVNDSGQLVQKDLHTGEKESFESKWSDMGLAWPSSYFAFSEDPQGTLLVDIRGKSPLATLPEGGEFLGPSVGGKAVFVQTDYSNFENPKSTIVIYPDDIRLNLATQAITPALGPAGQIAWSQKGKREGEWDLWLATANLDGKITREDLQVEGIFPSFSPDGTKLVFAARSDKGWDLKTLNLVTRQSEWLTEVGDAIDPEWGPNGIVFTRAGEEAVEDYGFFCYGGCQVWHISPSSQKLTKLGGGQMPTWLVDQPALEIPTPPPTATPTPEATSTPIITPTPTTTPTPAKVCGTSLKFQKDVTLPDGSKVKKGQKVEKVWLFKVTGDNEVTADFQLKLEKGNFKLVSFTVEPAQPGKTFKVTAVIVPQKKGRSQKATFQLYDECGKPVGRPFWVKLRVR